MSPEDSFRMSNLRRQPLASCIVSSLYENIPPHIEWAHLTMISSEVMDRRSFIKTSGLLATVAFIPSQLWGCGDAVDEVTVNADWEARAGDLESRPGKEVLCSENPSEWSGKVEGHVPQVELNMGEGSITVRTNHGMSEEHYIPALYVRNQDGIVVGLQEFSGTDTEPVAMFTLPKGTMSVIAYSFCKLHDHWKSESTTV